MANEKGMMSLETRAQNALVAALAFLERRQKPNGEFEVLMSSDPSMAANCSVDPSVFPTSLIAQALSEVPSAQTLYHRALDFIASEVNGNGLWSHWTKHHPFRTQLPPDVDNTSCASQALQQAGRAAPPNRKVLLANRNPQGLFYTWIAPRWERTDWNHRKITLAQLRHARAIADFFRDTTAARRDVDAVVNANALFYLGACAQTQPTVEYLLEVLRCDAEAACDKWYGDRFVIWYFLSRALKNHAPEAGALFTAKLAGTEPQTPQQMALALNSWLDWSQAPTSLIVSLLDAQASDGGWPSASLYYGGSKRRPDGSFYAPKPDMPHWGSPELSTAFAIQALARWRERNPA